MEIKNTVFVLSISWCINSCRANKIASLFSKYSRESGLFVNLFGIAVNLISSALQTTFSYFFFFTEKILYFQICACVHLVQNNLEQFK